MDLGFWIPWYWGIPILAAEITVLYYVDKAIKRRLDEREHQLQLQQLQDN